MVEDKKEQNNEEEKKEEASPPPQPFSRLFSFATHIDIMAIIVGAIAATTSGL